IDGEAGEGSQTIPGRNRVVAPVGVDHDVLDRAGINRECGGTYAVDANARTIGGDGECFRAVAAVHFEGIGAIAAFGDIAAVAWSPDDAVVAALAKELVVARSSEQQVVAVAAQKRVSGR